MEQLFRTEFCFEAERGMNESIIGGGCKKYVISINE